MSSGNFVSVFSRKRESEEAAFPDRGKSRSKILRRHRVYCHASHDSAVAEEADPHILSQESTRIGRFAVGALAIQFPRPKITQFYSRRTRIGENGAKPRNDLSQESYKIGSSGAGSPAIEFPRPRITKFYSRRIREGDNGRKPKESVVEVSKGKVVGGKSTIEEKSQMYQGSATAASTIQLRSHRDFDLNLTCSDGHMDESPMYSPIRHPSSVAAASTIQLRSHRDFDLNLTCSESLMHSPMRHLSCVVNEPFGFLSSDKDLCCELLEPSDDFSSCSRGNASSSATYSHSLQIEQQFLPSSFRVDPASEYTFQGYVTRTHTIFEDEEDEESYMILRSRERGELAVHDYSEVYGNTTDDGRRILLQRVAMVKWMIQYSSSMELHHETLFLGVSLMDHFLSRGYFKSERNLQLLGIACITLATQIEENRYYSRFYLKAAKADGNVQKLSTHWATLSLLDHQRLSFRPSTLAAAIVILACSATKNEQSVRMVMETHTIAKNDDLRECIEVVSFEHNAYPFLAFSLLDYVKLYFTHSHFFFLAESPLAGPVFALGSLNRAIGMNSIEFKYILNPGKHIRRPHYCK
ncbi:cyclin-SDS-like [Canna indica]|uniref:Cyclin-SDS-like n=1 Tax=Canna indica TaxID=4628 RepID=A0AAQ3JNN4_9LILI|nr:cyclin-SDS-like [Canna indica]